jgi:hypothetical protein
MPNHCSNQFTVRGNKEDVIGFIVSCVSPKNGQEPLSENQIKQAIIQGGYNDDSNYVFENFCLFTKLKPMPEELKNTTSPREKDEELINKYGSDNWYDWANNNWGTKWGCYNVSFESLYKTDSGEYEMMVSYDTAWSPGDDFLMENLAVEDYKNLTFHLYYQEPGMGFHGFFFIKDGSVVDNGCENYNEFPTSIGDALDRY